MPEVSEILINSLGRHLIALQFDEAISSPEITQQQIVLARR